MYLIDVYGRKDIILAITFNFILFRSGTGKSLTNIKSSLSYSER